MKSFEINFDDLTERAQEEFLEFMGLETAADGNFDVNPIAIFCFEDR